MHCWARFHISADGIGIWEPIGNIRPPRSNKIPFELFLSVTQSRRSIFSPHCHRGDASAPELQFSESLWVRRHSSKYHGFNSTCRKKLVVPWYWGVLHRRNNRARWMKWASSWIKKKKLTNRSNCMISSLCNRSCRWFHDAKMMLTIRLLFLRPA